MPIEPAGPMRPSRPAWADVTVANPQVALAIYLCTVLHEATADLYRLHPDDAPGPAALFDRFLGWARRTGMP